MVHSGESVLIKDEYCKFKDGIIDYIFEILCGLKRRSELNGTAVSTTGEIGEDGRIKTKALISSKPYSVSLQYQKII